MQLVNQEPARVFCLLAAVAVSAVLAWCFNTSSITTHCTRVGEHQSYRLPGGTTVALNTLSCVRVQSYSGMDIVTVIRGEMLFKVAGESARSLIVFAGHIRLEHFGTIFGVRLFEDGKTTVTVYDGLVELSPLSSSISASSRGDVPRNSMPMSRSYLLMPGDRVSLPGGRPDVTLEFWKLSPDRMFREQLWQYGYLKFSGESVLEVAREFNRYNDTRILMENESVCASIPVYENLLLTTALAELIDALQGEGKVQVSSQSPREVVLACLDKSRH